MARDISQLPGDIKRRLDKLQRDVERGRREILRAGAQEAKEAQLETIRGDAGGDTRLSRVRSGRGANIGARWSLNGDYAEVSATGPIQLLANPTQPHRIPKERQRGRRRVVVIPGVGVRAYANHPGTPGKDTWNRGRERAETRVQTVIGRKTDQLVTSSFQGGG